MYNVDYDAYGFWFLRGCHEVDLCDVPLLRLLLVAPQSRMCKCAVVLLRRPKGIEEEVTANRGGQDTGEGLQKEAMQRGGSSLIHKELLR